MVFGCCCELQLLVMFEQRKFPKTVYLKWDMFVFNDGLKVRTRRNEGIRKDAEYCTRLKHHREWRCVWGRGEVGGRREVVNGGPQEGK